MQRKMQVMLISLLVLVVLSGYACQDTKGGQKEGEAETEKTVETKNTLETGVSALEREFPEEGVKVLILYDSSDTRLEEISAAIQRKIGGVVHKFAKEGGTSSDYPKDTESTLELSSYELILVGSLNQSGQPSAVMEQFLETTDFQGKRISPFWLNNSQEPTSDYEEYFQQLIHNGKVLPGLKLTWEEDDRKEELGQIDGWLTSACTLK